MRPSFALAPILLALALLAASSCSRRVAETPGAAPADSLTAARADAARQVEGVAFDSVSVSPSSRRVALALGGGDSLVLARGRARGGAEWEARVMRADGTSEALEHAPGALVAAGTSDLHADGTREALWVLESGGTGMTVKEFRLYCPRARRALVVALTFMRDHTRPVPGEVASDEFERAEFALEGALLDRVKREHGYVTEADLETRARDPRYAFYFWARDNASLTEGAPMRVRRYSGPPRYEGATDDTLSVRGVLYTPYAWGGLVAWDPARNEHWVVFHPAEAAAWPSRLALVRDILVVGTHGEGLAFVRIPDLELRHARLPGHDAVDEMSVTDSTVVVNGQATVAIPRF